MTGCFNDFSIENRIIKSVKLNIEDDGVDNFGATLLNRLKVNPEFIGQVDAETGKEDTYGEMADRSVRCALWLRNQNIGLGDVVGICTHNHLDQLTPALAALYVGAIINPWWDYGLTKDVAKYFLNLTKPKVVFVDEENVSVMINAVEDVEIDTKIIIFAVEKNFSHCKTFNEIIELQNPEEVKEFTCVEVPRSDHPACLLYTSGSTGRPKAVEHSHKSLRIYIPFSIDFQRISECQTGIWFSTLCWFTGIMNSFMCVLYPLKRVVVNIVEDRDVGRFIEKYKVNYAFIGTSMVNQILSSSTFSEFDLTSVNVIFTGGYTVSEKTLNALRKAFSYAKVLQAYGTTEMMTAVIQKDDYKPNSHGTLCPGFQMKIIDPENGKILGANEEGEACFKSPFMMIRYFAAPEETKLLVDDEGFYHSGDLAYYDEDGAIFIVDRIKELIKWRGHHVAPVIVEKCIKTNVKSVIEVAVVPAPHFPDIERPLAFVVREPGSDVSEEEIARVVEENMPDYARLRGGVKFLDEMPRTSTQKINRQKLKSMAKIFTQN